MSCTKDQRNSLTVLNRREALYGIAGCSLAVASLNGCLVSKVYGDLTDTEVEFDVNAPEYEALKTVGGMVAKDAGGWKLVLIRTSEDEVVCLDRLCPHEGAEMATGQEGYWDQSAQTLICTRHGSIFSSDGRVQGGVADVDIRAFAVDFDPESGVGKASIRLKTDDAMADTNPETDERGSMETSSEVSGGDPR